MDSNGYLIMSRIESALSLRNKRKVDLTKDLGLSSSLFASWRQRGTIPNADVILNISDYLQVSPHWIVFGNRDYAPTIIAESDKDDRIKFLVDNFLKLKDDDKSTIEAMINYFVSKDKKNSSLMYQSKMSER